MEQKKSQKANDVMDIIDKLFLFLEQMKEINGVISDICCHTCSLGEDASEDLRINAYHLVSRQLRLAVMSSLLDDRISDMDTLIDTLCSLLDGISSEVIE